MQIRTVAGQFDDAMVVGAQGMAREHIDHERLRVRSHRVRKLVCGRSGQGKLGWPGIIELDERAALADEDAQRPARHVVSIRGSRERVGFRMRPQIHDLGQRPMPA